MTGAAAQGSPGRARGQVRSQRCLSSSPVPQHRRGFAVAADPMPRLAPGWLGARRRRVRVPTARTHPQAGTVLGPLGPSPFPSSAAPPRPKSPVTPGLRPRSAGIAGSLQSGCAWLQLLRSPHGLAGGKAAALPPRQPAQTKPEPPPRPSVPWATGGRLCLASSWLSPAPWQVTG